MVCLSYDMNALGEHDLFKEGCRKLRTVTNKKGLHLIVRLVIVWLKCMTWIYLYNDKNYVWIQCYQSQSCRKHEAWDACILHLRLTRIRGQTTIVLSRIKWYLAGKVVLWWCNGMYLRGFIQLSSRNMFTAHKTINAKKLSIYEYIDVTLGRYLLYSYQARIKQHSLDITFVTV